MFGRKRKNERVEEQGTRSNSSTNLSLDKSLEVNIDLFRKVFFDDETLVIRKFQNMYLNAAKCGVLYIDGMVNNEIVNENIIQPVLDADMKQAGKDLLDEIQYKVIVSNEVKESSDVYGIVSAIINGNTAFFLEGYNKALIINTKGWERRSITEPESERVIRGPREGFTESIITNLALIRRRIKSPDLKFKFTEVGIRTRTSVCICYVEGIASENIINELYTRLEKIDLDGILDSGYLQEYIKDSPFSPFETVGSSERPDTVAGKLLEGRIAVIVDGSPFALTLPFLFIENFQVNEDYYNNYVFASINRIMRILSAFLSISIPAIYIGLSNFSMEMIPTPLLLSISAARKGVPFPSILEAILMLFAFELLREAGARMPSAIGTTVSIVGAIVLGQAAVEARVVSAIMVIVVALTGISSLLSIKIQGSLITVRLVLLLLSSFLGIYGYIFGLLGLVIHLFEIRSFGVPYMLSFGSLKLQDIKDTTIRAPWWFMYYRPRIIAAKNLARKAKKRGGETT